MLSDLQIVDWSNHDRTNPSDQYLTLRSAPRAVQVCPAEGILQQHVRPATEGTVR